MSAKTPVGVLLSGGGTNLHALIQAQAQPDYPAEIALVLSNREDAGGLVRAKDAGIPGVWVSHRGKTREEFDAEMVAALQAHGCQWVAMAGFMRLVSPVLLDAFPGRVLNIHPALLPAFPGLNAQAQAFEAGVQVAGATVHMVDSGVDSGPIIAQGAVPRLESDTLEQFQQRILEMEHRLYPMVLRWAAQGRIHVEAGRAVVDVPAGESRTLFGD